MTAAWSIVRPSAIFVTMPQRGSPAKVQRWIDLLAALLGRQRALTFEGATSIYRTFTLRPHRLAQGRISFAQSGFLSLTRTGGTRGTAGRSAPAEARGDHGAETGWVAFDDYRNELDDEQGAGIGDGKERGVHFYSIDAELLELRCCQVQELARRQLRLA